MSIDARHILVGLRYGIGDVVMELPVLAALRSAAPNARITAVGAEPAVELLEADASVDAVVTFQRWGITHRWDAGGPEAHRAVAAWLEGARFDLILDGYQLPGAVAGVLRASGIARRESDGAAESAAVCAGAGAVEAIAASVRAGWGIEVSPEPRPAVSLRAADRDFAEAFLMQHGVDGAPVAVAPGGSLELKCWPVDRFAEVVDWITDDTDERVVVFSATAREAAHLCARVRHPARVVEAVGLHLLQAAALLEGCRLLLCNDTGMMHVAAAVGTATLGIFGPTVPEILRPPGADSHSIGGTGIECPHRCTTAISPPGCWSSSRCLIAERGCIEAVGTEAVKAAAGVLLGSRV